MKNIILIFIVYLLTSSTNLFSQVYQHSTLPTNYFVKDGCFINANTGWLITDGSVQILKTTNKGNNWVMIYDFQNAYTIENSHTISFINENVGWLSFGKNGNPISYEIYKTTNSGINWNLIYTTNSNENILEGNIKFFNEIEGYFLTNYNAKLLKTTNGGYNWNLKYVHSDYGARLTNIQVSPLNSNIIYVSGMTGTLLEENLKSIYLKSTNKFDSYTEILDGINDPNGYGGTSYLSCVNDNGNDLVRNIFSKGFYKLKSDNSFEEISTYNSLRDILSFSQNNKNIGFVSSYRRTDITSNGGVNWITENTLNSGCISGASQFNHIYYLYGWQMPFISRLLAMDLSIIADIELISGNMIFDGENKPVSSQGTSYYLRGGYSDLYVDNILNPGLSNERIFYKWQNNNMNSPLFNYYFDSPGEISAYYKTKLQSTTENAINIPSQTKAVRDNFGRINSIHTSMGGVFFTKSYNNGSNFTTEEIINDKNSGINSCATENNINPFIYEALSINLDAEHISSERNVVVVWERREGNNVIIDYGQRHSIQFGYPYYWDPRGNPSPYRITINSENQNFKAYPKVFAKVMYENFSPDTTYDFWTLIAHLKPGGNNNQLVVTGKKSQGANPQEFIIDGDNIESFSAVRNTNSIGNNQVVHFVYKKNSDIFYKKVYFGIYNNSIYADSNNYGQGCSLISMGDKQISRFTPDISLRNGRPVIAYRGDCRKLRIISFEGDEPVTESIYNYPIIVRFKYLSSEQNVGEVWSEFIYYNSPGNVYQDEPNVEGSKDALAYVVNFRVANSYFKKFVLIKDYPGYSCSPGTFSGKDAKLVRGSYQGNFGTNSYPTLLTLTQNTQNSSLYDVWKQTFTITNTPSSENPNTNLVGVIRDMDINYYFNLGPIIAKNIICSLEDDLETVVENPVEFNENMISQPFSLSNGDTLLVGGLGSYSYYPGCDFGIKKFDVNLLIKSTNQLQRNLFSDTILYEDSIETEYLRGFIIDNIQNGTDSFYIQLVVAPEDITDGSFLYSNVYSPDEEGGDNPGGTKSRYVFFEKGKSGNNQNIPTEYSLSQNFPNPFNPVTKIQFEIPKDGLVNLKVYDVLGREVKNLVNEVKPAGRYTVLLDGSDLSSGVYFYRIESGDFVQVKRMILLK